jgi:pyruvate dehydrogenase E1 component beta subunit
MTATAPEAAPAAADGERVITYAEALNEALREEMHRDPTVFVMGEDVAGWGGGGVFGVTKGLADEFGTERIRDTPISEEAIAAVAIGAAATGSRPGPRSCTWTSSVWRWAIVNQAAKLAMFMARRACQWSSAPRKRGRGSAAQHSQSLKRGSATSPA